MDASQAPELLQRLLTRMDQLEYRLIRDLQSETYVAREEVDDMKHALGRIQRGDASMPAPPPASHRGPGGITPHQPRQPDRLGNIRNPGSLTA